MKRPPPTSTLFPYTTLFRSTAVPPQPAAVPRTPATTTSTRALMESDRIARLAVEQTLEPSRIVERSEEHTSELQSHVNLVCRLLLEKKKTKLLIYTSKL